PNRMNRSFSWMKAQQAPSSPLEPRQAWPLGALQTASINAQRIAAGIAIARKYNANRVRIVLKTLVNRLALTQAMMRWVRGGGRSGTRGSSSAIWTMAQRSTSATERL